MKNGIIKHMRLEQLITKKRTSKKRENNLFQSPAEQKESINTIFSTTIFYNELINNLLEFIVFFRSTRKQQFFLSFFLIHQNLEIRLQLQ